MTLCHWHVGQSRLFGREKNTLKLPFWGNINRPLLTLGGAGGQTVDTRSMFGGIKIKTAAGRWIISRKPAFSIKRAVPENFWCEIVLKGGGGTTTQGILTHLGVRNVFKRGLTGVFDRVIPARSRVMPLSGGFAHPSLPWSIGWFLVRFFVCCFLAMVTSPLSYAISYKSHWQLAIRYTLATWFHHPGLIWWSFFPSPSICLLFLLRFSFPPQKKIFSFPYFPPFPFLFFFSSAKNIFSFSKYFPPFLSPFFLLHKNIFSFSKSFPPFPCPFFFPSSNKYIFSLQITSFFSFSVFLHDKKIYFPSPNVFPFSFSAFLLLSRKIYLILQIFSSFSFSVFLLLRKNIYFPCPNIQMSDFPEMSTVVR